MFNQRFFFKYWVPVIAWMTLIYVGSTDLLSSARTSRWLTPLIRWIYPQISSATLYQLQFLIRKAGHVTEYAILALLIWRTLVHVQANERHPRPGLRAFQAWLISTGYAATDEIHQSFHRSRGGSPWDVLIDGSGAAAALLIAWGIGRWRKWW
ncbi:MAG TPA: VanZ family protein [Candidatus Paceibacterota bacterium]|nr:VanZ family protein [Candidatus Paceibacterota bacterium]